MPYNMSVILAGDALTAIDAAIAAFASQLPDALLRSPMHSICSAATELRDRLRAFSAQVAILRVGLMAPSIATRALALTKRLMMVGVGGGRVRVVGLRPASSDARVSIVPSRRARLEAAIPVRRAGRPRRPRRRFLFVVRSRGRQTCHLP